MPVSLITHHYFIHFCKVVSIVVAIQQKLNYTKRCCPIEYPNRGTNLNFKNLQLLGYNILHVLISPSPLSSKNRVLLPFSHYNKCVLIYIKSLVPDTEILNIYQHSSFLCQNTDGLISMLRNTSRPSQVFCFLLLCCPPVEMLVLM